MDRVSVFVRRRRINNLEQWTLYAIFTEAFFLALSPTIAAAAVMIGVITFFLRSQIDSKYKMRSLPFDVPVAIFLLIGAVSVFLSSARSFELIYNYCSLVGIYALTYLIVGQSIRTPEQVKQIAQALGASAILVVLWGFFQFIFGIDAADVKWTDPEAFPELKKRVFSTLENPNVLAGYLNVFICLALGLLAKLERRSQKIILIAAIILFAACLAMTYSRGAFFTLAIVFAVYGFLQDWRIMILFAIVTGLISYGDSTFMNRILSTFTMSDSSEGVRVGLWVSTSAMISDHPFAGIGWGAYQFVYPQYNYYIADPNVTIYHAHNIYLNYAAEIGIVGALAFFWYFFGTMFISFGVSEYGAEKWLRDFIEKIFESSAFLRETADILNKKLEIFSDIILNMFGKKKPVLKLKKGRKHYREVVHNEDLNFSEHTRKKFADSDKNVEEITSDDENISENDDKKSPTVDWNDVTDINDKKFLEGIKLGIGFAFLSVALNGFTDDLLFNIPTSMLMWLLGALGAAIHLMPDENFDSKVRRRRI
ncbi:MAG: O-antigen ligase family protein [Selenomonadaceae bacterium]|nr:O-antigen ligase family protein [Selenomonadaceae bacterium]